MSWNWEARFSRVSRWPPRERIGNKDAVFDDPSLLGGRRGAFSGQRLRPGALPRRMGGAAESGRGEHRPVARAAGGAWGTATFFTLGWVAERRPELIRRIAGQGH